MRRFVNIYIFLLLLYYLQGVLYAEGSLFSRLLLVILLFISLYFWFYSMFQFNTPIPLKLLSIMLIGWTFYGIWPILYGLGQLSYKPQPFAALKAQYLSLLPIFVFYIFAKKKWLTEQMLRQWTIIFIIIAIITFYYERNKALLRIYERGGTNLEITNNASYIIVSLMPLIPLFWRKPLLQYLFLGGCLMFTLLGMKRGAVFGGVLCFIWFLFQSFMNTNNTSVKNTNRSITRLLFTIILIVGAVYFVQNLMETSDYFNNRIEKTLEGNSSNRNIIYKNLLEHFLNEKNFVKILFGNGAYGTLKIGHGFAHNDWLEIAIDNGIVYLFLYAAYWISLISMLIKGKKGTCETMMLGMFVIIYFSRTMFSMSYNDVSSYAACAFGFALANYETKPRIKNKIGYN